MTRAAPQAFHVDKDLALLPVFQGIEPEIAREIFASAQTVQYPKGTVFQEQAATISRYLVVLEGLCGASKSNAEGQEALLQIYRRGDYLFESIATQDGEISLSDLRALTPVRLLSLAPSAIRHAERRSTAFASNMRAALERRNRELQDHIEQIMLHNAEERVGRFLLRLRFSSGAGGRDIILPFDKSLIASYLGIKPETLSRVFQSFRERGFVLERSHLTMPDVRALCVYCDKVAMRSCPFALMGDCRLAPKHALKSDSR